MIKEIKHQFFTFRNGIVADTLRQAGYPYSVIFGLQLPQLTEIARSLQPSRELAMELWAERHVRESRLLACYLFPKDEMTKEEVLTLIEDIRTPEEADILTFRLLRHLQFRKEIIEELESTVPDSYIIKALRRFDN